MYICSSAKQQLCTSTMQAELSGPENSQAKFSGPKNSQARANYVSSIRQMVELWHIPDIANLIMEHLTPPNPNDENIGRCGLYELLGLNFSDSFCFEGACSVDDRKMVDLILQKLNLDIHKQSVINGGLRSASLNGHRGLANYLISIGGNPKTDHQAMCERKDLRAVQYIGKLDLGTIFWHACTEGFTEYVRYLTQIIVESEVILDDEIIFFTAVEGHVEITKILLSMGCPADDAMYGAAQSGNTAFLKEMLPKGGEIDCALGCAAFSGAYENMNLLLDMGANPTSGIEGAIGGKNIEANRILLRRGANISAAEAKEILELMHEDGDEYEEFKRLINSRVVGPADIDQ